MSTILLIVESHVILSMIEKIISEKHEVLGSAHSVTSGLEKFKLLKPDVVMVDVTLCSKDDEDIVTSIRSESPETRIILVSKRGEELIAARKLEQGVVGLIGREEVSISDPERRTAIMFKIDHLLKA